MVGCEMCGMEVPVGVNGRCFIGHPLPGHQPVVAMPAPASAAGETAASAFSYSMPESFAAPPPPDNTVGQPVVVPAPIAAQVASLLAPAAAAGVAPPSGLAPFNPPAPLGAPGPLSAPAALSAPQSSSAPQPLGSAPPQPTSAPQPLGSAPPQSLSAPQLGSAPRPLSAPQQLGSAPPQSLSAPQPLGSAPPQSLAPQPLGSAPPQSLAPQPLGSAPQPTSAPQPLGSAPPRTSALQPLGSAPQSPAPLGLPVLPPSQFVAQAAASAPLPHLGAPPVAAQSQSVTYAPIEGTAALNPEQHEPMAVAAPQEFFLVSSDGGERKRGLNVSKPVALALGGLIAIVAAFGGYKVIGSLTGGSDAPAVTGPIVRGPVQKPVKAQAGPLQRAFVANARTSYGLALNMKMTVTAKGKTQTFNANGAITFTEQVLSRAADGTTTLRYTFDRVSMKVDGQQLGTLKAGTNFTVTIAPDGSIRNVGNVPGEMDASFFEFLAPVLPKNAAVGQVWTRTDKVPLGELGEPITSTTNYRLSKIDGGNAIVDSTSDAPFNLKLEGAEMAKAFGGGGQAGSIEVRGRVLGNGQQTVDRVSGRTIHAKGGGSVTMAFITGGQEIGRMAMAVDMTLTQGGGATPPGTI